METHVSYLGRVRGGGRGTRYIGLNGQALSEMSTFSDFGFMKG